MSRWQPYPEYKDSGVEWLGEIPAHWEMRRLKYAAPESNEKLKAKPKESFYLGLENIESGTGHLLLDDLTENVASTVVAFRGGDVLFGKLRPYLAKVVHADFDGVGTTELLVLRPKDDVESRFLFYYLLSDGFIDTVNSSSYGAKMPRANSEQVGDLVISLPPLPEQRAIAAFLDRQTARLDALVTEQRRLSELLQERRVALISHAVTRGVPPGATHFGSASHLKMKDSGIPWLGEIPAHWETFNVKQLAKRIQTGSTPPTSKEYYYQDGVIPWFGPGSFEEDLALTKPVKLIAESAVLDGVARLFDKGSTMIVTIGATLGKAGYLEFPASSNQQITAITFNSEKVFPKFAAYQLKRLEPALRAIAPNTTLPILNQQEVGCLPLCLPPLSEQRAIAAYLDRETAKLDAAVAEIETSIARLEEYRTALVSAAVTGKIDVRREA